MGKLMISLNDKVEKDLRDYLHTAYYDRVGALSIVAEAAVREYLLKHNNYNQKKAKS